ncbi:MAG: dockerin type I domain-containing protein [Planctomycetota bacterium]|jgi:hypothetical protein
MSSRHLLIVAVVGLFSSAVHAGTLYVDDDNCPGPGTGTEADPYCSIQDAIDAAVDTDEIVVAPGTYFEVINLLGKAVTVRSSDGPETTTIDAQQTGGTVVGCWNGEGADTILQGFTITGGMGGTAFGSGMINNESTPTVINCMFTGNHGLFGGGMWNIDSSPTVINCTFSANVTDNAGGGMLNIDSSPIVANCTFSGNSATSGRALACGSWGSNDPHEVEMTNCILWNGGDEIWNSGGPTIDITYSDVQGGWSGSGNIDADPLFVDPENGDFRLSPGSPCIDAGDNTAVPEGITTDLAGDPRFVDDPDTPDTGNGDPPIVDMGAYELQLCLWDLNVDGEVNVLDLIELVMSFGPCEDCPADFDDDGFVNVVDLIALIMNFGPCPGTPCVWDVNGDGVVDQSDVEAVISKLGPCKDPESCPWDVNGDGVVDGSDVQAVATHFGPCP